jgi:hypothetical protein
LNLPKSKTYLYKCVKKDYLRLLYPKAEKTVIPAVFINTVLGLSQSFTCAPLVHRKNHLPVARGPRATGKGIDDIPDIFGRVNSAGAAVAQKKVTPWEFPPILL